MSKGWDNATLKKLKSLMGKGLSTSEIGKRLGLSKNAVVGKLNRLGWNLKAGGAPTEKEAPAPKKAATTKASAKKTTTAAKATKTAAPKVAAKKTAATKVASKKAAAPKAAPKKEAVSKVKETPKEKPAPKSKADGGKTSNKNLAMHQRIIQHSLEMANLKPNQCRWPIGDPDSEHFHFCGATVFVGKPYCYEHCKQAYQFTPPKKK